MTTIRRLFLIVSALGPCSPALPADDAPPLPIIVGQATDGALAVQFRSLQFEGAAVAWDFGDGATSEALTPTHTYQLPGEYSVVVRMKYAERFHWGKRIVRLTSDGLDSGAQSVVSKITFAESQTEPTPAQLATLETVLSTLKYDRNARVEISSVNGQAESATLAHVRGTSVQKYLLAKGISRHRIEVQAFEPCDHCVISLPELGEVKVVAVPPIGGPRYIFNSKYSLASNETVYRVWFGTNRKPVDRKDVSKGFTSKRDTTLHYGHAYVRVPRSHSFGSLGSSWIARAWKGEDDRIKLRAVEGLNAEEYLAAAGAELASRGDGKKNLLVYIHGYNNSFEDAVIRAGQIGTDLKVEGITALFSWPSEGSKSGYPADEATIQASEPFLEQFLVALATIRPADRIDVLAHSMGNRALLSVANTLNRTGSKIRFGQIILAAPDVDAQTFRQLATAYPALSRRTTLYTSSKDLALYLSKEFHKYPRAGYNPPVTLVNGIDTITVSDLDLDIIGHDYFGAAAEMLYDIFHLLTSGAAPKDRIRLMPKPSPPAAATYWAIQQ